MSLERGRWIEREKKEIVIGLMAPVKVVWVCWKNHFEEITYKIRKLERGRNSFVELAVGTE